MLKWLPNDKNKNTTQESTYINNIMSEINDMDEWPEGIFPINLKTNDQYQRKDPSLLVKYKMVHTKPVLFVKEVINILAI